MNDLSRLKKSNKQDVPGDANEIHQHHRGIARRHTGRELVASRQGIYFAYHPQWVAQGFNLSPLNMDFTTPESC